MYNKIVSRYRGGSSRSWRLAMALVASVSVFSAAREPGGAGWSAAGGAHWGGAGGSSWNDRGWSGSGHGSAVVPSRGMSFTRNSEFTRGIVSRQGIENVPGHYYYHNAGGVRYWHYFGRGLHWYGFYWGPRFFWLPFYAGYWWWWDVNFSRWVFWSDGYWWWYAPGGVVYVDVNNDYVPYDQYEQQNPSTDMPKPPSAPPTAPPSEAVANTPAKEGSVWKSSDGTRMVQIAGNNGEAILYDESSSPPTLIKTLATTNVEKVRFTGGGASGKPLQILVDYKDGSFALFDANGNRTSQ